LHEPYADPAALNANHGTVLVTGASGFLAGFIIAGLRDAGWKVVRALRSSSTAATDERRCDFLELSEEDCVNLLQGVDAVVNVAGILREPRVGDFDRIHHDAPLRLAMQCVAHGVSIFIQISALGKPEDGEFIASKQRFDVALLALPLRAVVLRPSVVYSTAGSYGGTSMLRAMAATPAVTALPGDGQWPLQPVAAEDLAQLVLRALQRPIRGCFEVGGPEVLSLREYQTQWRHWLGLPTAWALPVPVSLVKSFVSVGELVGRGPMGRTMWRMLRRGNVTATDAGQRLQEHFEFSPRRLIDVLAARPSQTQDRWQAQLYFLAPALQVCVVGLFLLSAWVGWCTLAAQIERLTAGSLLESLAPVPLARAAAALDLLLGLGLLVARLQRQVIVGMLGLVGVYTLTFGLLLPGLWLDPLGGLAKNLVVLPALAILWVLAERR